MNRFVNQCLNPSYKNRPLVFKVIQMILRLEIGWVVQFYAMDTRIPDLRASGVWTKDVGLEYAGVLREFTKLKDILRSMHSR